MSLSTAKAKCINKAHFNGPKACPWVSRIVSNTAKDIRRRQIRHREVPLPVIQATTETPEAIAQERQLLALLREMVSQLPDAYRQVLELRVYGGLSGEQTADRLHISRSNVSTRLSRAVNLLQRQIDARLGK
jgi:RNA polymerase sigma-70 factor (ECF subfamily)